MIEFDRRNADALRALWFVGDVHGEFKYLAKTLLTTEKKPNWIIFLGDIDVDHRPFKELLEPLWRNFPSVQVAFIHGNHDADTYEHWEMLHDCGPAMALHGTVAELNGIRVAGLGGTFMGRIWSPPNQPSYRNKAVAMEGSSYQWRDGQRPHPSQHAAIYHDDIEGLSKLRADILVTHEAPSCHPHGFDAIDRLAWDLGVVRSFHGHHHDDLSDQYALVRDQLGFDARAVNYCSIKNGLGEIIFDGPKGW